jgi:hypothetical protein
MRVLMVMMREPSLGRLMFIAFTLPDCIVHKGRGGDLPLNLPECRNIIPVKSSKIMPPRFIRLY